MTYPTVFEFPHDRTPHLEKLREKTNLRFPEGGDVGLTLSENFAKFKNMEQMARKQKNKIGKVQAKKHGKR